MGTAQVSHKVEVVRSEEQSHLAPDETPDTARNMAASIDDDGAGAAAVDNGLPVLELVLLEEEMEVITRVVPREPVRVFLDSVETTTEVTEQLAHEVVAVDGVEPLRP